GADDFAADGDPQPRALGLGREERIENLVRCLCRYARAIVNYFDYHHRGGASVHADHGRVDFDRAQYCADRDAAGAIQRFESVGQQVREHLRQLIQVAVDHRQLSGQVDLDLDVPPLDLRFGQRDRLVDDGREVGLLDLQPNRPHEFQHLDHDRVGQLRLAHDVGEERLGFRRISDLAPQQAGHDLDTGERVLQLVGNSGGHFPQAG